jgi:hypothetical protein
MDEKNKLKKAVAVKPPFIIYELQVSEYQGDWSFLGR